MKRNRGTRKLFASNQAFVFNLLTICYFKIGLKIKYKKINYINVFKEGVLNFNSWTNIFDHISLFQQFVKQDLIGYIQFWLHPMNISSCNHNIMATKYKVSSILPAVTSLDFCAQLLPCQHLGKGFSFSQLWYLPENLNHGCCVHHD
jgi:hypothetical protein